jgi:sugar lactone lactonase YvrE
MKTFRKIALAGVVVSGLAVLYLLAWPVPIRPVVWNPSAAPGYVGPHAPNTKLAQLQMIDLKGEVGPEHIVLGKDGKLYTTVLSGNILRMAPDGRDQQVFANTGGRVLGFDFDAAGNLIAADAMKGLLSIAPDGKVTLLTDKAGDTPILYANSVVVARSGKIYFSDASMRFAPREWGGTFEASVLDILEQASTGRVLEYDPASKLTRVVAQGLSFANGVALSADERTLFVNETGQYRIWKVSVAANHLKLAPLVKTGSAEASVLFDNLPGYPDNLMRGLDGRIWVGLVKPRNPKVDQLAPKPWMRSLTLRLPRALWPIPKAYGHVFAFNEAGQVVADLQDPSGAYPETTSVLETRDRLYMQSLHAHGLGWLPR